MSQRKIPGMLKDEHGVYLKPPIVPPTPKAPAAKRYTEPKRGYVSLDDLLARCLLILWREVRNLHEQSHGGNKLTKEQSLELRENVKLLMDMKKKEKDLLDGLTDDELDEMAKAKGVQNDSITSGGKKGSRSPRKAKASSTET